VGSIFRSHIERHAKRSPAQAKLAGDVRTPLRQAVPIGDVDRERSISLFAPNAALHLLARP